MAEFILKDQYGKEKTFDRDKIFVMGTDGELVQFTQGEGDVPAVVQPLEVTENGTYTAPDGVDGFNEVVVNVDPTWKNILVKDEISGFAFDSTFGAFSPGFVSPAAFALEAGKTYRVHWDGTDYECVAFGFTNQGEIVAIGNGSSLDLPGNGEPFLITCNITYNNTQLFAADTKESHVVGIWEKVVQEITLQDKTITENGTYTADSGYDGLGSVTVEVAGSGGGSLPAGIYWQNDYPNVKLPNSYEQRFVVYNGYLYSIGFTATASSSKNILAFRKYDGSAWTQMATVTLDGTLVWLYIDPIVYNGKIHLVGAYSRKNHVVYDDENGAVKLNAVPATPSDIGSSNTFIDDGKLKYFAGDGYTVYAWDESTDTWTSEVKLENGCTFFDRNGEAYYQRDGKIYKYHNGVSTEFGTTAMSFLIDRKVVGDFVYTMANSSFGNTIYRVNLQTGEEAFLGRAPGGTSDTNYYSLVYYDGKLRLMGANGTKRETIAMYEVIE